MVEKLRHYLLGFAGRFWETRDRKMKVHPRCSCPEQTATHTVRFPCEVPVIFLNQRTGVNVFDDSILAFLIGSILKTLDFVDDLNAIASKAFIFQGFRAFPIEWL